MEEIIAISEARALLKRLGVNTIPVDVTAIAGELGFDVKTSEKMSVGESGQLFTIGDKKHILVNGNDSAFRQRFTVLHEIAHDVLNLPSVHGDVVSSSALESYASRPKEEILCDVFAAECLVPWQQLAPMTQEYPYTAETIELLAEEFQASRPCVASRFAQTSRELLVYVLAENEKIRYVVPSRAVRERRYWISIGVMVPKESAAALARRNGTNFAETSLDGSVWSSSDCANSLYCDEEAILLDRWQQTLSLLTLEEIRRSASVSRTGNREEDELLPELTGELPWPKR